MTNTRAEIIAALRHHFGPSEHTKHLIDWVHDLWETKDFLFKHFGYDYTSLIVEAVPAHVPVHEFQTLVRCELTSLALKTSLLN